VNKPAAVQDGRTGQCAEQQPAGKSQAHENDGEGNGDCEKQDHFAEHRESGGSAGYRHRGHNQPEQRERVRQADNQQQNAHGLHDGDSAQIAAEFARQRDYLGHRTGGRPHQRRQRIPAMNDAEIGHRRGDHAERSQHQQHDACRPGRYAAQRFRRHDGAKQRADNDVTNARERKRQPHRAA